MPKLHKGKRVLPDLTPRKRDKLELSVREKRLDFAASCVADVLPSAKEDQKPKYILIPEAARKGAKRSDCPRTLRASDKLETYISHNWRDIKLTLAREYSILACYINGPTFGAGGFRAGDNKLAQKQVNYNERVAQGVVDAKSEFAEAAVGVFPKIAAKRHSLHSRAIR